MEVAQEVGSWALEVGIRPSEAGSQKSEIGIWGQSVDKSLGQKPEIGIWGRRDKG